MKKALMLAIVLLNLLSLTEVSAQNYSSETGLVALLNKILADAMSSDVDIYSVVFDESYGDPDFSEYGDFSQEINYYSSIEDYQSSGIGDSGTGAYKTVYIDKDGNVTILEYYDFDNDDTPPTAGSGGANSENGNEGEPSVGSIPCDIKSWNRISVANLKLMPGVHLVNNLPESFLPQSHKNECVLNALSIVAGITEGSNPESVKSNLKQILLENAVEWEKEGIYDTDIRNIFFNDYSILDDNYYKETTVQNYIDEYKKPVMAIVDVTGTIVIPYEQKNNSHMVTIIGYDFLYYYCAVGFEDPCAIPKKDLNVTDSNGNPKYKIYFYNGKKH